VFHFCQPIDVPGVQHQRLLADRIGIRTQREAHVAVVQIVRRTDRDIIDLALSLTAQLVDMPIEPFELGEEMRLREVAVDDPDGVVAVERSNQNVAGRLDRHHVTRCDVAGGADQGEAFHCSSQARTMFAAGSR
jgi:hypothetical protein